MADTQRRQTAAVKNFFDGVAAAATVAGNRVRLSREAAASVIAGSSVPDCVGAFLAKMPEAAHGAILDSVLRGMDQFKREHGFAPDASLIEQALHNATPRPLSEVAPDHGSHGLRLDSATSAHHDQLSLNPVMAATSIMAQFAEAIPFAAYLPADIKTNEARLAILTHQAKSAFGDYADGASLDGIAGGGAFIDSERLCVLSTNGGGQSAALTFTVNPVAATTTGSSGAPLLRGRTVILVNGLPVASATRAYSGSTDAISGSVTISGTTYTITGTVNPTTGVISVSTSANLPAGTKVHALAYIDFEAAPDLAPVIGVEATIYNLIAKSGRAIVKTSIDALTQMQAEVGIDPRGQGLLALRAQYAQERHRRALQKMLLVATNNAGTWDYDLSTQIAQKDRSQIWMNLAPIVAGVSQTMANTTVNHGVTTLYVTGELSAQVRGLPLPMFEPSGITDRPGIYRLGRLFGLYDVYHTPWEVTGAVGGSSGQILAIGRSQDVARNPLIMGDAVAPVILPLAMSTDFKSGDGFYTRSFTELNPHQPSAQGAALISVTNIN